jgi:hypothetical protein
VKLGNPERGTIPIAQQPAFARYDRTAIAYRPPLHPTGGLPMVRVRLDDILAHKKHQLEQSLASALRQVAPDAQIDAAKLFAMFRQETQVTMSGWVEVPQNLVQFKK